MAFEVFNSRLLEVYSRLWRCDDRVVLTRTPDSAHRHHKRSLWLRARAVTLLHNRRSFALRASNIFHIPYMASEDHYLAVLKASFDYEPQDDADDELAIKENQILFLIERTDDSSVNQFTTFQSHILIVIQYTGGGKSS